jgi:hypothetical protein
MATEERRASRESRTVPRLLAIRHGVVARLELYEKGIAASCR